MASTVDSFAPTVTGVVTAYQKACRFLEDDPEIAMIQARKAAEGACRVIFAKEIGTPGSIMLDELIRRLHHDRFLPRHIALPLTTIQSYGNYTAHAQDDPACVTSEYVLPCIDALAVALRWFFRDYLHQELPTEIARPLPVGPARSGLSDARHLAEGGITDYRIASLSDLRTIGYDTRRLVDELLRMDYDTLEGINEHHAGRLDQWIPVVENNPDGIKMLLGAGGEIVGYWHFVALRPSLFSKATMGQLFDEEITSSAMQVLGFPGVYQVYFVCVAVVPDHRGYRTMKLLFQALCQTLRELAESDIFIEQLCATAFTPEGVALCESARMQHMRSHEDRGEIYWQDMKALPYPFSKDEALMDMYSARFANGTKES